MIALGYKYGTIREERPDLVEFLVNETDADRHHLGSNVKLDWICPNCGNIVREKTLNKVVNRGIPCMLCSDGVSKPEKIVSCALIQSGVDFIPQKTFRWSGRKRYDYYIPDHNMIIEVHGTQHYTYGFKDLSGITYDQQLEIDRYKYNTAVANGISLYKIVDARDVADSAIVPQIEKILSDVGINTVIDSYLCEQAALKSNVTEAARYWNEGLWSSEIAEKLGVSVTTTVDYLHTASNLGICDYSPIKAQRLSQERAVQKRKRKVRCVQTGEVFDSVIDAGRKYNISSPSNIIRSCRYDHTHAGTYNGVRLSWQYV